MNGNGNYPTPQDDRRMANPCQALCPKCGYRLTLVSLRRWAHTYDIRKRRSCSYKGLPVTRAEYTHNNPS